MPPTKKRPGPDARKKEIIDAAIEVFGEKNYNWATTKEIAQKAGVSERLVFVYFKSKKELYLEVGRVIIEELFQMIARGRPPLDDIKAFFKMGIRNYIDFLEGNPLKMKLLVQSLDVIGYPDMREFFRPVLDNLFNYFRAFLVEGQKKGTIPKDLKVDTAIMYFLGLMFICSYAKLFDLDWYERSEGDIYAVGDYFVDSITQRRD